ncbi:MAG: Smr/MutS family protein [Sphingobacteriales bacterium]|nr:Smr/MutS family protein [Sphingobacteriales bacterium]
MARIKVDLHDIYNNSKAIDKALQQAFEDAIDKKIKEVEIIPGKGSGQLRKKVERFLQMPHIKPLYHRIENDCKNFGRYTDWTNNIVQYRLSPHCTICLIPSAFKIYKILAYYIKHIGIICVF